MVPGWAMTAADLDELRQHLAAHAPTVCHPSALELEQRLAGEREPVILLGWSMGGMLAIEHTLRHPGTVQALILLSTAARFLAAADHPGVPRAQHRAFTAAMKRDPERTLSGFFARVALPHPPDSGKLRTRTRTALALEAGRLPDGLAYLGAVDLRDDLARLALPVLVVHGSSDEVIPCEAGAALAAKIPGAQWQAVPRGGHDLPGTHPEQIATMITGFLAALDRVATTPERPAS
jgi:pimeloyl-[acyl-carrier protein] methyl ester esterase